MINAGIAILAYTGSQAYNAATTQWENILVQVNYPSDQNITNNPIAFGDLLIEPNGNVWSVMARSVVDSTLRKYTLSLVLTNGTPSEEIVPEFGGSPRCAIVTPKLGFVAPYWDASVVTTEVGRIASMVTANTNVRENTADVDKPISSLVQTALNAKMSSGAVDLGSLPPV